MDDKPISKAKPCKICSGFGEMFEKTKGTAGGGGSKGKASDANAGSQNGAGPATSTMADKYGCPENVQTVGRAGWSVLHSMAATYPDAPSPVDQSDISSFISLFAKFYPCGECAHYMKEHIHKHPPTTSTRVDLARWMCGAHNEVNERLGKPIFDCNIEVLDQRWLDGWEDGSCKTNQH